MTIAVLLVAAFELLCGCLAVAASTNPRVAIFRGPILVLGVMLLAAGFLLLRRTTPGYWLSYAALVVQVPMIVIPTAGFFVALGAWAHLTWRFQAQEVFYGATANLGQLYLYGGGASRTPQWIFGVNLVPAALIALLAFSQRYRRHATEPNYALEVPAPSAG